MDQLEFQEFGNSKLIEIEISSRASSNSVFLHIPSVNERDGSGQS